MKKFLFFAVLFQVFMVSRAPSGMSAESLLAARAITQGQVPYRDFFLHVGPLPADLLAALFSIPVYAWCSLIFIGFNFLTAWGLYRLALLHFGKPASIAISAVFLILCPFFDGNGMFVETIMSAFGVWGWYFMERKRWWTGAVMFLLALATKQTAIIYPMAWIINECL